MAFFRKWKTHYKHKKFISEDGVEAIDQTSTLNSTSNSNGSSTKFKLNGSMNTKFNVKDIVPDDEEDDKPIFASYDIKYLGCTPVESKRSEKNTSEAIKTVIANSKAGGRKAKTLKRITLNVSQEGVEILDQETKDTLMKYSIYQISYCSVDGAHDHTFSFVSSEPNPISDQEQLSCHVFECPKRKIAHEITLMVAGCFESAYQLWRESLLQNANNTKHSGKVLKEHNNSDSMQSVESHVEVHEPNPTQNSNADSLLIDFAVSNNGSSSNGFQNFHGNNWVSFEDDFRDLDKNRIPNF